VSLVAVFTLIGCGVPDEARAPDPRPEKPTLETATLYVSGSNGGSYKVSATVWTPKGEVLWEGRATGAIEEEPTAYPIDLEGFKNNRQEFFLSPADINIEAGKTQPWEGDLAIVLKVNGTLVECDTIEETYPGKSDPAYIDFDADNRENYEAQNFKCEYELER
jgi:hypothetical protein